MNHPSTDRPGPRRLEYTLMTGAYWSFTVTDGALRMLVLLHFYTLGYSPLQIATLFLFYEFFGVITNLIGGWVAGVAGLKTTLTVGLLLQIVALLMLGMMDANWAIGFSVAYVMAAQGLSGIAKDLVKMSSKSSVKLLVTDGQHSTLFKWVAVLTGSKNALKGVGFFVGGVLLDTVGFRQALVLMAIMLLLVWLLVFLRVTGGLGRVKHKVNFAQLFSKSRAINLLSTARFFLFGSRDIWFVVGLPLYLSTEFGWTHSGIGAFLAAWVIGYGFVQILAPGLINKQRRHKASNSAWAAAALAISLVAMLIGLWYQWSPLLTVVAGLCVYGVVFAVNSSIHSYLILAYSHRDHVSMDVGFYYMANAGGRLAGTVLSGWLYQSGGLIMCLSGSLAFVIFSWLLATRLPEIEPAE